MYGKYEDLFENKEDHHKEFGYMVENDTTVIGMPNFHQSEMTHSKIQETQPLLMTNEPKINDSNASNQETPDEIIIEVEMPAQERKCEAWMTKHKGSWKIIIPAMDLLCIFLSVISMHYMFMTGSTSAGYDSIPNGSTMITFNNTAFEKNPPSELAEMESIILTKLVDVEKFEITDPESFSSLPENPTELYLLLKVKS